MVYNTQNHWVLDFCHRPVIFENRETQRFGNWICFRPQVSVGDTKGSNTVRVPPHLRTETYPVSETLCSSSF
jgi:hypothetical protein